MKNAFPIHSMEQRAVEAQLPYICLFLTMCDQKEARIFVRAAWRWVSLSRAFPARAFFLAAIAASLMPINAYLFTQNIYSF